MLTSYFGSSLGFLDDLGIKNLKLFREIKRRKTTAESLQDVTKPARSIRFKFELNGSDKIKDSNKFKELSDLAKSQIQNCQQNLQATLEAMQKLEIESLTKDKMETAMNLIGFLSKAYMIHKPEYTSINPIRAVDKAIAHPSLAPLFLTLTEEAARTYICRFFGEDITLFEEEETEA